jgi:hypothetical protein
MNNWLKIIENLTEGSAVTVDPDRWNLDNPEYTKILDTWKKANFKLDTIKWTNYYPGKDFTEDVVTYFADVLALKQVHRAWISKIDPGYMAPWHWDVDDNEEEYLKHGTIKRYTVIINQMANGHVLIVGKDYYYNKPDNTIIKWGNYKEWHSSMNGGLESSYLFHILGS